MRVHLLFAAGNYEPGAPPPWNADALVRDLALDHIFQTMAADDKLINSVVRNVILASQNTDIATIERRQAVLRDCLANPQLVRELYALAGDALAAVGRSLGILIKYPDWVLRHGVEVITTLMSSIRQLRALAKDAEGRFKAQAWIDFFDMVGSELDDAYLSEIERHLAKLGSLQGIRLSTTLGKGNKAAGYSLLEPPEGKPAGWLSQLLAPRSRYPGFDIHPRDESGARALSEIRDRGISRIASAVGHSAYHMQAFFTALRHELAFYVGALNLHRAITERDAPTCWPDAEPAERNGLCVRSLADLSLVLRSTETVLRNDIAADDRTLIVITGANQGGKSTFLRSLGTAQLLMQAGMFVPARRYVASVCDGLFTHYKREEDSGMDSGKLDEELARMSDIVEHFGQHPLILFNESFAATNEHEGLEISNQIIGTLHRAGFRVICVTHLYSFARTLFNQEDRTILFLRAGRRDNGERTFQLVEGEPLSTSFGRDLYKRIFADEPGPFASDGEPAITPGSVLEGSR